MRIVLWICAFTFMLYGFGEALNVTAGYRTSSKGDNDEYLAIIGKPLTIWVKYGLPKKDVITIEMKKSQNEEFFQEFYYQEKNSDTAEFSDNLKDRATYQFTDDGMEITITSIQMNDSGMYFFIVENSDNGYATFSLKVLKSVKDEKTSKGNIRTTATKSTDTIPTDPELEAGIGSFSSDAFNKTMIMIFVGFIIVILVIVTVMVVLFAIGYRFFTRKFKKMEDKTKDLSLVSVNEHDEGIGTDPSSVRTTGTDGRSIGQSSAKSSGIGGRSIGRSSAKSSGIGGRSIDLKDYTELNKENLKSACETLLQSIK